MISTIPPVIGFTIVLSYILLSDDPSRDDPTSMLLAENMLLHHTQAFTQGFPTNYPVGEVSLTLAAPYVEISDWRTEIVEDGGIVWLITWAREFGDPGSAFTLADFGGMLSVFDGRYVRSANYGEWWPQVFGGIVGLAEVPNPLETIPAGAPVLATPIERPI